MGRWQSYLVRGRDLADRHQTKVRFILAGALNTALGLVAYPAIYFMAAPLKLHYLTIMVISQVVCVTSAFLTTKFLVFRTTGNYLREFRKFITFHIGHFLVNLVMLPVMVEFGGMNPVWAQTLFAALVIVTSYFWHSRITFHLSKPAN